MTEPIKIFRGDDTDFIGNKIIEITLETDIDLSGITADFLLCGFKQHFESETVASKRLEVVISHDETKRFPLGRQLGTLVLKSADGKIKHVDTQIEFFVTNKTGFPMFCGDEQIKARFGLKIKWDDIRDTPTTLKGYGIEDAASSEALSEVAEAVSELDRSVVKTVNGQEPDKNGNVEVETGGGGTTDYNNLENKPAVNGVTLSGNKTAAELGLATAAQGEKADSAYQKPQAGIPASDMAQAVQASLGKANGAVQKSGDTMTGGLAVPNLTVGSRKEDSTIGEMSIAEGFDTVASGFASHAEGDNTVANSKSSHAEGAVTKASGRDSHAEGNNTTASGDASHAEGRGTAASGDDSHAEGTGTTASGEGSHAEGYYATASVEHSHAEGYNTTASGEYSHAEGYNTTTQNRAEHAQGRSNVSHTGNTAAEKTLSSIGFGSSNNDRKNAVEVMYDGKAFVLGVGGYDGTNPTGQQNAANDLATEVNGKAPLASPSFTGTPTAPTPAAADNSTKVATTAFVKTAISGISVTPLSGRNFNFATTQGVMDALKATIEALGGSVTNAPTTPVQNNQTQGE